MTDKLISLIAFAVLAGFVGILVYYVPRPDLMAVVGATMLLVAYDFFIHKPPKSE